MCVIQIGEPAGQLSEDTRGKYAFIPWRSIKDTCNFYVHAYGSIDLDLVWETITTDIPALKKACKEMLE